MYSIQQLTETIYAKGYKMLSRIEAELYHAIIFKFSAMYHIYFLLHVSHL